MKKIVTKRTIIYIRHNWEMWAVGIQFSKRHRTFVIYLLPLDIEIVWRYR